MNLYEDQFLEKHDFPFVDIPEKILVIASTGRSGSHMLGHSLYKTRKFGFPLEYANPANLRKWKERFSLSDFNSVMHEIQRRRCSENGVFGIKIHYGHLWQWGGYEKMDDFFDGAYYVFLKRKNALSQAVSNAIAIQTGVWIAGQKPVKKGMTYDFHQIHACLRKILFENSAWLYLLSSTQKEYLEVDFDELVADMSGSIQRIADFTGVNLDSLSIPDEPVTYRQSSSVKKEWIEKYRCDYKKRSRLMSRYDSEMYYKVMLKLGLL